MNRKIKITTLLIVTVVSLCLSTAKASTRSPKEKNTIAKIEWLDENQTPLNINAKVSKGWLWSTSLSKELKRPVFRVSTNFPPGYKVRLLNKNKMRGEVFHRPRIPSNDLLVLDTISKSSQANLELTDPEGQKHKVTLAVTLDARKTMLWTDKSCLAEGFSLSSKHVEETGSFLYLASICRREKKQLNVTLIWAGGTQPPRLSSVFADKDIATYSPLADAAEIRQTDEETRNSSWLTFNLPLVSAKDPSTFSDVRRPANVGRIAFDDSEKPDGDAGISLNWMPRRERPVWDKYGGLSLANYRYSEGADSLKSEELAVVGHFGVHHDFKNRLFDFESNLRLSLAALSSNTSSSTDSGLSSPRYYQADARFGYLIPRDAIVAGLPRVKVFAGAQIWGMLVDDSAYGVKLVMGPQFGVQLSDEFGSSRQLWQAFALIAPVSDKTITVQLHSYKFTLGGSYELSSAMAKNPWSLFGELEWISMTFTDSNNSFQSFTPTLGLRVGF